MDVNRLSQTLSWLRIDEKKYDIQAKLNTLIAALQNLSSNPGQSAFQTVLTETLQSIDDSITRLISEYDPAKYDRIVGIGAKPFFTESMIKRIRFSISDNPMSPAVALQDIQKLASDRSEFLKTVIQTEEGVDSFVPYSTHLKAGEAAVGFELPRSLFNNEFRDFISELKTIQRIVRVLSEVETGTTPDIKLGTISSSDPLIFLQTPPAIVMSMAAASAWILTQWKKFEEIRKLRAETAKLNQYDESELEEFFDKKIKSSLDSAVEARVEGLMNGSALENARKSELKSELGWAYKALFARVERGMRIEVAVQAIPEKDESTPENIATNNQLGKIEEISSELKFPRIESNPILSLPNSVEHD